MVAVIHIWALSVLSYFITFLLHLLATQLDLDLDIMYILKQE